MFLSRAIKKRVWAQRRILGALSKLRKATSSSKSARPHRINRPPSPTGWGFFPPEIQHMGIFSKIYPENSSFNKIGQE